MLDWKKLVVLFAFLISGALLAQNHVLRLDGNRDYLQLSSDIFAHLDQSTIEGWVKWEKIAPYSPFFCFGSMLVASSHGIASTDLQFYIITANRVQHTINIPNILRRHEWYHIAAVSGREGMKLYFNGILVGENTYSGSASSIPDEDQILFGFSDTPGKEASFRGLMDEIRLWQMARSPREIQQSMSGSLQRASQD